MFFKCKSLRAKTIIFEYKAYTLLTQIRYSIFFWMVCIFVPMKLFALFLRNSWRHQPPPPHIARPIPKLPTTNIKTEAAEFHFRPPTAQHSNFQNLVPETSKLNIIYTSRNILCIYFIFDERPAIFSWPYCLLL